jgi:hypothetical protein
VFLKIHKDDYDGQIAPRFHETRRVNLIPAVEPGYGWNALAPATFSRRSNCKI